MTDREPVQIGVDLRPLPLDIGGEIWLFNPDPGKEFFAELAIVENTDDEDAEAVIDAMYAALNKAILPEMLDDFVAKSFGLKVLTGIANALTKELTDLPTVPSSASGKTPAAGGGRKSSAGRPTA